MACTYDAADNTLSSQCGGSTYNYAYDNANHLVQVQANGAVMADYTYNLNNERLSKTVGGNTDRYVYNEQSQLLGETGSAHRDYLWLDDLPIGVVDNGSTVNYLIADALNTPRVITAVGGATVWYWPIENNAFGEQQPIGSFTYNLRFPGQYCDAESGLFYNVHRYYEPLTGRYVQADPIGFASGQLSWYAYGNNNPLMYVDPYGLWDLPSIPQPVVDFSAGMGDTLSFGVTNWVRDQMGTNDVVDQCSTSYDAGEWAGIGTSTAIGGAAGWRAAGTKAAGKEFSHWIPNRMGGPRSLWNGNYVTPARHYYHDPFRYPSGWRSLGDKWPAGIQQFDRIPNVYKGAGAGAGLGGMGAAINGTY